MTIDNLPGLEELVLVPATPEQVKLIIPWQHDYWSYGGKNLEEFCQQQQEIYALPWTQGMRQIHWVLVKRGEQGGQIYAVCESRRRDALNKPAGSSIVEQGHIYGIASVQTPKAFRRRGYATHMLSLLHLRLSPPTSHDGLPELYTVPPPALSAKVASALPKATASVLWSDVGRHYYGRISPPSLDGHERPGWVIPDGLGDGALRWKPSATCTADSAEQSWAWIYYNELDELGQTLSAQVKADLESRPVSSTGITTFDPASPGLHAYLMEEARQKDWRKEPYTEPIGARFPRTDGSESVILFVPRFFEKEELSLALVHRVEAAEVDRLLPVLSAALEMTGCEDVVMWGLDEALTVAMMEQGATRETRKEIDGHLLGITTYEEGDWELANGQAIMWC